jgi:ribulose-5-phosphate 4-epimerase/fuculose-1-phosphate aldolase
MGDANVMILRNHGTLAVGRTVPEAFRWIYNTERACEQQGGAR